jgi:SAM-dependent methyltransferase
MKELIGSTYSNSAEQYDQFAEQSKSWVEHERPLLEAHLAPLLTAKTRFLDAGCGNGRTIAWAVSHGVQPENITGVDVTPELAQKASARFPEASIIVSDLALAPLPKEAYDIALSSMVPQYFDDESLKAVFACVRESLRHNGNFTFVIPHPFGDIFPKTGEADFSHVAAYFQGGWRNHTTPWGADIPYYQRAFHDYVLMLQESGFELTNLQESKRPVDPTEATQNPQLAAVKAASRMLIQGIKK